MDCDNWRAAQITHLDRTEMHLVDLARAALAFADFHGSGHLQGPLERRLRELAEPLRAGVLTDTVADERDELRAKLQAVRAAVSTLLEHGRMISAANPGRFGEAWRGASNTAALAILNALDGDGSSILRLLTPEAAEQMARA
jgi:hypothetical protein